MVEESDEEMADLQDPQEEGDDSDIVESDVELEGDTVDPDNDPPQKVLFLLLHNSEFWHLMFSVVRKFHFWVQMGDPTVEVSEEDRDASQMAKGQAMEAISEGNVGVFSPRELYGSDLCIILVAYALCGFVLLGKLEEAIGHLTEAILLNPTSAIMYGTRGRTLFEIL